MSVTAMAWAWEQRTSMPEKVVLAAIASMADHGHECTPTIGVMADMTGACPNSVRKAIRRLSERRLLVVEHRKGPGGGPIASRYRLLVGGTTP